MEACLVLLRGGHLTPHLQGVGFQELKRKDALIAMLMLVREHEAAPNSPCRVPHGLKRQGQGSGSGSGWGGGHAAADDDEIDPDDAYGDGADDVAPEPALRAAGGRSVLARREREIERYRGRCVHARRGEPEPAHGRRQQVRQHHHHHRHQGRGQAQGQCIERPIMSQPMPEPGCGRDGPRGAVARGAVGAVAAVAAVGCASTGGWREVDDGIASCLRQQDKRGGGMEQGEAAAAADERVRGWVEHSRQVAELQLRTQSRAAKLQARLDARFAK